MSKGKVINTLVLVFIFWIIFLLLGGPDFLSSFFFEDRTFSDILLNLWVKGKIFVLIVFGIILYYILRFLNNRKYNLFLEKLAKRFSLNKWEYIFDATSYVDNTTLGSNTFKAIWGVYEKYFVTIWRSSMRLSTDSMIGNYHIVVLPANAEIEHKKAIATANNTKKELSWISMLQTQWKIMSIYNKYRKIKWKKARGWKEIRDAIHKVWLDDRTTYVFENWVVVFFTEKDSPEEVEIKLECAINLMLFLKK